MSSTEDYLPRGPHAEAGHEGRASSHPPIPNAAGLGGGLFQQHDDGLEAGESPAPARLAVLEHRSRAAGLSPAGEAESFAALVVQWVSLGLAVALAFGLILAGFAAIGGS